MNTFPQAKWTIGESATLTDLAMCINRYRTHTVGLYTCVRAELKLGDTIVYPDLLVMVGKGRHKQCEADHEQNYFEGPPNFVLDVCDDIESEYIESRKALFLSAGVQEYLIVNGGLSKIQWNRLVKSTITRKKSFEHMAPESDGVYRSQCLPGLWMPLEAIKSRNNFQILASIEEGVSRRPHHEFMDTIWNNN